MTGRTGNARSSYWVPQRSALFIPSSVVPVHFVFDEKDGELNYRGVKVADHGILRGRNLNKMYGFREIRQAHIPGGTGQHAITKRNRLDQMVENAVVRAIFEEPVPHELYEELRKPVNLGTGVSTNGRRGSITSGRYTYLSRD